MNTALWVIQILLAGMYGLAGTMKAFQPSRAKQTLPWAKERSDGFVRFIGASELLGALGLLLPAATGTLPWLTPLAAAGLTLIQLLAILTEHLPKREYKVLPVNILLLALSILILAGRWALFMA